MKVLHKILPQEEIAIVGISNWTLDPAKMNRAVLLNRPDPTPADLEFTGNSKPNPVQPSPVQHNLLHCYQCHKY